MDDPIDMWVKAGADGIRMGGDPVSHELFMVCIFLNEFLN